MSCLLSKVSYIWKVGRLCKVSYFCKVARPC